MARTPSATDFTVTVEGIGAFTFGRRNMRDEMRIAAEFSRLTEGVENPTPYLAAVGGWIAALKTLIVSSPEGWGKTPEGKPTADIDEMDPLAGDTYDALMKVHAVLREKEGSFRSGESKAGEE